MAGAEPTPVPPPSSARSALVLLLAINLFNYLDRYVLAAVVPNIREEFFRAGAISDATAVGKFLIWFQKTFGFAPEAALIGSLSMAFMVSYMVMAPVFGFLAERFRRWWLIGIGVILWSLASGASGLAMTFGALLVTRCFVGIGEAAYGPVAPTVLSDLYPVQKRGTILSWFYMATPVGIALGFLLGGQIASRWGWRWAFYAVVLPGLILGLICFFMREPRRGQSEGTVTGRKGRISDYRIFFKTPSYVFNTLGMTAMTFALGGIGFWMPDYIHHFRKEGSLASVNTIFGLIMVVSGLGATLVGGMLADRLRSRWPGAYFLVSGGGMLVGFPFFLATLYTPFPYAWIFVFLACFCLFINIGPSNTILANVTHPSIRASGFALNILVIHALGDVISPPLIGVLSDKYDMNIAFLVISGFILVSGIFWLAGSRYLQRDTQLAPHRLDPS